MSESGDHRAVTDDAQASVPRNEVPPVAPIGTSPRERRLHPSSVVFAGLSNIRQLIFPLVFAGISSGNARSAILFGVLFLATVRPLFHYLFFRYRLESRELVVRKGMLFRSERRIPYSRIQNIDLVKRPLHRIFKVAEVKIETATGGSPEAILQVLDEKAVSELRARALGEGHERTSEQASGVGAEEPETGASEADRAEPASARTTIELLRLPLDELVRMGLISNRGMVVVAAGLAALTQIDDSIWQRVDWSRVPLLGWLESLTEITTQGLDPVGMVLYAAVFTLGLFLVFIPLVYALSIALAIFRFYGFILTRTGNDFRSEFGLATRMSLTVPRARIQRLWTIENPFHRFFERVTVRLVTAGGSTRDNNTPSSIQSRQWLAPIIERDELGRLFERSELEAIPDADQWLSLSPRAERRIKRRSLRLALVIVAVIAAVSRTWWPLVLLVPLTIWCIVSARLFFRHNRYSTNPQAIFIKAGWWTRQTWVVRLSKIQSVSLRQSPFDRRHRMAHLAIDTAGGSQLGALTIPYLDQEVALELANRLNAEAEAREFVWG